jgi:hypothetical protein
MDAGVQRLEGLITTSRNYTPAPAAPVSHARLNTHVASPSPPLLPGYSEDPFFELLTVGRLLTDTDADPSDPHPSTISMQASVHSPSSACSHSCSCRCHLSSALRTPSWLQPVLGSVLLSYSCIPLFGVGPCDQANCVRASSRTELTYYFPARVLKRALCFSIEVGGSFGYGAGLYFGVPRVFSSHDEAWETVNFGGSEDLKRVWAKRPGPYYPLDVNEAGMSLLMVRLHQLRWPGIVLSSHIFLNRMQCRERTRRPQCFSSTNGGYASQKHRVIGASFSFIHFRSIHPLIQNASTQIHYHGRPRDDLPPIRQLLHLRT